jgi:hypothetical protein
MQCRDSVVIDMQIRRVDDADVAKTWLMLFYCHRTVSLSAHAGSGEAPPKVLAVGVSDTRCDTGLLAHTEASIHANQTVASMSSEPPETEIGWPKEPCGGGATDRPQDSGSNA